MQRRTRWRSSKARLRLRLHILLAATDTVVLLAAFAAGGVLRFGTVFDGEPWTLTAALLPLYGATAFGVNAYSTPVLLDAGRSVRCALKALAIALAAVVFFVFLLQAGTAVSRLTFAFGAGFSALGLAAARWFIGHNASAILGGNAFEVFVICDGVTGVPDGSCTLFMDGAGIDPTSTSPSMFDRLGRLVADADRVIVACPPERRLLWASALQGANVQGEVIAPELVDLQPLGIANHQGIPTVIVAREPLTLRDRLLKRALDLTVAGIALILLAPLLGLIALGIRLTSPGPVIFRQPRLGQRNVQFEIMKFRSMRVEATDTAGHRSAARDDDRVTPLGRILRATSLDELPQLFNVLRGDMSMVGPRPHALGSRAADQLFWEVDSQYWGRHAMKPGLTGLAQVRGFRGATVFRSDLTNRLRADLEYRQDWSIWRDMGILLRTAPALFRRNAF